LCFVMSFVEKKHGEGGGAAPPSSVFHQLV